MNIFHSKILYSTLLASWLIILTACGGGGGGDSTPPADTNISTPPPAPTSITHNGITYGFVTSPFTGKVWLDKNLGAARVCEQLDDSACFGDYYQWGRAHDGHQDSTSGTTTTQADNVFDTGTNGFIKGHTDWASVDASGATRSAIWSRTDGTSVCPIGFRVPTSSELRVETIDAGVSNSADAFNNFLKLPVAGYRKNLSSSLSTVNHTGLLWTSSVKNSHPIRLAYTVHIIVLDNSNPEANGESIRCIQN